jgi:hypothetical protein
MSSVVRVSEICICGYILDALVRAIYCAWVAPDADVVCAA